jgi:hypothetical protein
MPTPNNPDEGGWEASNYLTPEEVCAYALDIANDHVLNPARSGQIRRTALMQSVLDPDSLFDQVWKESMAAHSNRLTKSNDISIPAAEALAQPEPEKFGIFRQMLHDAGLIW